MLICEFLGERGISPLSVHSIIALTMWSRYESAFNTFIIKLHITTVEKLNRLNVFDYNISLYWLSWYSQMFLPIFFFLPFYDFYYFLFIYQCNAIVFTHDFLSVTEIKWHLCRSKDHMYQAQDRVSLERWVILYGL